MFESVMSSTVFFYINENIHSIYIVLHVHTLYIFNLITCTLIEKHTYIQLYEILGVIVNIGSIILKEKYMTKLYWNM